MSTTGSPPVRFPAGTSNSAPNYVFGNYPKSTPPRLNEYFNDFMATGAIKVAGRKLTTHLRDVYLLV